IVHRRQSAACRLPLFMILFCNDIVERIFIKMSKKSKKNEKNYLDFIPVKNPDIEYETDENGIVTVFIEWKGFYHKIAQKIFRRPRVSDIKMDKYGSFVWHAIDDEKDVHQLSKEMESEFPKMEKSLSRLIKFLEIMKDNNLIYWKGEEKK
ncbi:PqqD family protein, partial [[Ruminococcus] torques]